MCIFFDGVWVCGCEIFCRLGYIDFFVGVGCYCWIGCWMEGEGCVVLILCWCYGSDFDWCVEVLFIVGWIGEYDGVCFIGLFICDVVVGVVFWIEVDLN